MDKDFVLKDLKAATYNPRMITDHQLHLLSESIKYFGDLSGVVFNARTRTLISGHQRIKTLSKKNVRIVTKAHTDNHGTVRLGHLEVTMSNGVIHIPFRVVDWDRKKEKRANIAANAHGGKFDDVKLAALNAQLGEESQSEFDIELLGLNSMDQKKLKLLYKKMQKDEEGYDEDAGSKEIDVNSFEFEHQCPKCGYGFDL